MKRILLIISVILPVLVNGQVFVQSGGEGNSYTKAQSDARYLEQQFSLELIKKETPDSILTVNNGDVGYGLAGDMPVMPGHFFRYDTTTYFTGAQNSVNVTTVANTANTIRAWPIFVQKTMTFDKAAIEVTTAVGSSHVIMGVYADNGSTYPGALLLKTMVFDGNSATVQTQQLASDLILYGGRIYWIAHSNDNTGINVRANAVTSVVAVLGATTGTNSVRSGVTVNRNYDGDLPTTFPAGGTYLVNQAMPILYLQQK